MKPELREVENRAPEESEVKPLMLVCKILELKGSVEFGRREMLLILKFGHQL